MSEAPEDTPSLSQAQLAYLRERCKTFAALDDHERQAYVQGVVRDVWIMENPDYDWSKGEPDMSDEDYTYGWTVMVSPALR